MGTNPDPGEPTTTAIRPTGQPRGAERRNAIIAFWHVYRAREKRDPTWRDICEGAGFASKGHLAPHMYRLRDEGRLVNKGGARGYQLVEQPEHAP
jgi:hypothetical protein